MYECIMVSFVSLSFPTSLPFLCCWWTRPTQSLLKSQALIVHLPKTVMVICHLILSWTCKFVCVLNINALFKIVEHGLMWRLVKDARSGVFSFWAILDMQSAYFDSDAMIKYWPLGRGGDFLIHPHSSSKRGCSFNIWWSTQFAVCK